MSNLINLTNINLAFGEKIIFKNTELSIHKGDKIGLIGLNGQGKSTLFKILNKEVTPDISTPPFQFDRSTDPFEIFHVSQELDVENYPDLDIEHYYLSFYPNLYSIYQKMQNAPEDMDLIDQFQTQGGWDLQNSYLNYLNSFELGELSRDLKSLSGGEQKKIALSIGLSTPAEVVLWDEPTNHLDIETIEKFEDELISSKKTYMIISHDRYLLNHTTDKICHIERGQINQFKGTYLDYLTYLEEREAVLAKNLDKLENHHRRELAWMRQGVKARGTRSKKRVEGYHNIKKQIADLKSRHHKSVDLDLVHSGRKTKRLISIKEGIFGYDDTDLLTNLNLLVTKKDKIALIGENGAGKSTLIKIFQEKLQLKSGEQKNADQLKIVVFDQKRESLNDEMTPMEFLGEGNDFVTLGNGQKKHINSYMSSFLFTSDQAHRPIGTLSGGEKNRLQLANFMKQAADIWVFDEPTNDLDIETIELLEKELKSYDSAVIIIGHDRAFLDNVCKTTWLIHNKKVEIFEGGYTQVAPYLHAIEQMKVEEKSAPPKKEISTPEVESSQPKKMTYQQKQRSKVIENEIMEAENALEEVEKSLASFDYNDMTGEKQRQFQELNQKKMSQEKVVEDLYAEWEELSQLMN